MPKPGDEHRVRQGECLHSLCFEAGYRDPAAVLDADENAELRSRGRRANQLAPGDVVRFPAAPKWVALARGETRTFRLQRRRTMRLRLELGGGPGGTWSGRRFAVDLGDGTLIHDRTDANGAIDVEIPVLLERAHLCVFARDDDDEPAYDIDLRLGHLDPIDEVTGVQARLSALGFYDGAVDGVFGPRTERAVRAFQARGGIAIDGLVGDATRELLLRLFGC